MDLLCSAYSNPSDEETEPETRPRFQPAVIRYTKRPRPENLPNQLSNTKRCPAYSDPQRETSVTGRYVSKRERALLASSSAVSGPTTNPISPSISSAVLGSIADSVLPHDVASSLRNRQMIRSRQSQIPDRLSVALPGHTKAINSIEWSTTHAHLLASAGLDNVVYIWNVWSRDQKKARAFTFHNAPVKDVKWSKQGLSVLSCGYDCLSRLVDVEKGIETQAFKEDQVVSTIKFHPHNSNLFLSGGSKGHLRLWDIRSQNPVHRYIRNLGPILDVEFTNFAEQFISSSDVSTTNISENAVIVWDVSREVPLSNQVYAEAYTCPSIKCHPYDPIFVAQSHGNYIAIFSANPPFKLNKYKRYQGHWVSGFPIKCRFSHDGEKLISGSSDGSICIYDYKSSQLLKRLHSFEDPCIDVASHPIFPNVIASCSWSGHVSVLSDASGN